MNGEEFASLVKRAREGDEDARASLVEGSMRLVWHIVHRFGPSRLDLEDLFQVGCIGLLKAVNRFDPGKGVMFSTYAVPLIIGEIRRYLRDHGPIKLTRASKRLGVRAMRRRDELRGTLGREPTVAELCSSLSVAPEELVQAMEGLKRPLSLDGALKAARQLSDAEGVCFDGIALREAVRALPPDEKKVITLRFFWDKTQEQVAHIMGISQPHVSRLERAALRRMQDLLSAE